MGTLAQARLALVGVTCVLALLAPPPAEAAQLKAIQSGEVSMFGTSITVPITPVDPAKTILVFGTRSSSDDPNETQVAGNFTTGQNDELTFARNDSLGTAQIAWYLAEFVSGVSVQRGSTTLTGTTTIQGISSVDLTKSFPLVSYRTPGPNWDGNDFVRTTLPSATQLQLDVAAAPNASAVVEWQIVEYQDAIVRWHGATMLDNETLTAVTPGYAIDPAKMWLVYSYSAPDSDERISRYMLRGFFDGGGGFSFDRYVDGVEVEISAFVVEFTDVTTVRHGTATWAIGPPLNLPVTISPSVDLDSSIAVGGYQQKGGKSNLDVADSGISTAWAQLKLTGATSMIVHRGRADEAAQIDWSVIEFSDPVPTYDISGTVFEDVNYGGGAGRDQATSSGVARDGARVELYDDVGAYVSFATTDGSGNFSFAGLTPGDYTVRVVNSTVTSSRTGYVPGLLGVQTYRTDASSGSAVAVTNKVGGQDPSVADAGNGSAGATMNTTTGVFTAVVTGTAQSIANVTLGAADLGGVDFGYNFDTIVNTNATGQGSLDQFMRNANALDNTGLVQAGLPAGEETSLFMIPGPADSLGRTVDPGWDGSTFLTALAADLPIVIDPVRIDGYTQEGTQPNTVVSPGAPDAVLLVTLDGAGAIADGFNITAGDSTVRGMIVTRFPQDGIDLESSNNTVEGNYIGTDASGASLGNLRDGVRIAAASNIVGGSSPGARNVISDNGGNGVFISSDSATANFIQGNYIGTHVSGTLGRGNTGWGFRIQGNAYGNTIGGAAAGEGNVISDNGSGGIRLNGTNTVGHVIQGNLIGTDAAGTGNLGNTGPGVHLEGEAWDTTIGGIGDGEANTIAFNGGAGVTLLDPDGGTPSYDNPIRGNSIHSNGGLGIDLDDDLLTGNDAAPDDDDGANRLQNYPELSTAGVSGVSTTVTGTLTSALATTYDIDFYSNPAADVPTGYGEGEVYLGSDSVTTDGVTGIATINTTLPVVVTVGHVVTATATDPNGNTSEFSQAETVIVSYAISGTVFEDVNYGGGLGRDLATAQADAPSFIVRRGNVTVELYDAAGAFVSSTTTAVADGSYSFTGLSSAVYTVRVVSDTVTSSRPGSDGSELGVQTYRIDGDGEPAGAGPRKVGGELPSNEDAAANSGAQTLAALQGTDLDADGVPEWTQSIVSVDTDGPNATGVDFGFNFDVVVNTNDAGQGTLRQFILNSNLLN